MHGSGSRRQANDSHGAVLGRWGVLLEQAEVFQYSGVGKLNSENPESGPGTAPSGVGEGGELLQEAVDFKIFGDDEESEEDDDGGSADGWARWHQEDKLVRQGPAGSSAEGYTKDVNKMVTNNKKLGPNVVQPSQRGESATWSKNLTERVHFCNLR